MPWKVKSPVSERMEFVSRLKAGERMTDLCLEFGISRKTGYKLQERFEKLGPVGLFDVSRRPRRLARLTPAPLRQLVLDARRSHPTWGARKLRAWLLEEQPGLSLPSASAMSDWLSAAGLVKARRRRPGVSPYGNKLREAQKPNDVWCVDYKGQFRLGNGKYCYPLTITDNFSRYLLGCEGFEAISGEMARTVFEDLFTTYGLPEVIRSDNGTPFASRSLFGLSQLSAWWLKLGILPERIEPAHPEQNGRHERMHRTLKAETTRPAGTSLLQQQERFDNFREEYNEQRPHEALDQKRPRDVYQPSSKPYREPDLTYPLHDEVVTVYGGGHVNVLHRRAASTFISAALEGERLGVRELEDGRLLLTFVTLDLGCVNPTSGRFHPADEPKGVKAA